MKKNKLNSKFLIFGLCLLLLPFTVFAKKFTIDELGKKVLENHPKVNYVYIIGEYAFTSDHELTTQDTMLSARSINADSKEGMTNTENIYKKMAIYKITPTKEIQNGAVVITGWTNDGDILKGGTTLEETINIKYIDYEFVQEDTKTEVPSTIDEGNKAKLKETFDYPGNNENLTLTEEGEGLLKVNGLVEYHPEVNKKYGSENGTGYYFGFVLKIAHANDNTIIKAHLRSGQTKEIKFSDFDKQNCSGDNEYCEIALLAAIDPNDNPKTLTLEVDLDGNFDDTSEYATTIYTIDYSEVTWPKESNLESVSLGTPSEEDEKTLTETWGYDREINKNLQLIDGKLTGTLVLQTLESDKAFGEESKKGYYFDFKFVTPAGVTSDKIKIAQLNGKGGEEKKVYKSSEYDKENNLTILFRFPAEKTMCSEEEKVNCKLYFTIDYDGAGTEYLPFTYEIDYSEVKFEQSSKINVSPISIENASDTAKELWHNWIAGDGYKAGFSSETENPHILEVNGLITIFNGNIDVMSETKDYYLAFKITKDGKDSSTTPENVKFLTGAGDGEDEKVTAEDFKEKDSIYVLKWLNPDKTNSTKQFTLTVDFDEGETYAPYTLTFKWENLKFQSSSAKTEIKVANSKAQQGEEGYILENTKNELTTWSFDFDKIEKLEMDNGTTDNELILSGDVKEQEINSTPGFETNSGYYVVLNIYGPTPEQLKNVNDAANKWTIQLKNEKGVYMDSYKPNDEEYGAGFVSVLLKLKEDTKNTTYKIDWDGAENQYLPYEVKVNYEAVNLLSLNKVTYNYLDSEGISHNDNVSVYENEEITPLVMTDKNTSYREFEKWTNSSDENIGSTFTTSHNKDENLTAHWILKTDEFIDEMVKNLNDTESEKFIVKRENNDIIIDIKNTTTKLSDIANTNIPKAIAYILEKEEVKNINLSAVKNGEGTKNVSFTKDGENSEITTVAFTNRENLVSQINAGAKKLFEDVLGSPENAEAMTLNKMVLDSKTFSISAGDTVDNVKYEKEDNSYTFKFIATKVEVKTEEELNSALTKNEITDIIIADNFDIKNPITINRSVNISSNASSNYTITAQENAINSAIFNVNASNVNISKVKLTKAQKAIIVNAGGALSFSNLDVSDNTIAGIEVKNGGNVIGETLTMSNESYDIPAIIAEKGTAKVNLTDNAKANALRITKQEIIHSDGSNREYDKLQDAEYNYYNYYNDSKYSKIYKIKFMNFEGGNRLEFIRYSKYGEKIVLPPSSSEHFSYFEKFTYDSHNYNLLGYSTNSNQTVQANSGTECTTPEGVSKELTATGDTVYYASYCVSLPAGMVEVGTKDEFETQIQNSDTRVIYIKDNSNIDYGEDTLNINRKVSIVGKSNKTSIIKAKKINITADEVFLQKVALEINAGENQDALITVNDSVAEKTKITLWETKVTNKGDKTTSALKVTDEKEVVIDVRWSIFEATNLSNYIYADGPLGQGTDIYLNTMPKLTNPETGKNSVVIVKSFAEDAVEEDGVTDIRLASNSIDKENNYAIKLLKDVSGTKADIDMYYSKDITIAAEYSDTQKDFSNINVLAKETSTLKDVYIKEGTTNEETDTSSISKIRFVNEL